MAEFFIHVADGGFPDEPWPGVRRLGPYNTTDEAVAQAVSDAVGGQSAIGAILGVFDDAGSEARREQPEPTAKTWEAGEGSRVKASDSPPVVTAGEIQAAAKDETKTRKARARFEVEQQAQRDELLQGMLAPGVTPDDLRDLGVAI